MSIGTAGLAGLPSPSRAWDGSIGTFDPTIMCVAHSALDHSSAMLVSPLTPIPMGSPSVWTDEQLVLGARLAWSEGRLDDARAMLDEATRRFPRIADHIAVMMGEIELEAGDPVAAETRFESALASTSPSLRLEARIGRVRAMVELGARDAADAVEALIAEFPELPDAERLAFARASALERSGQHREAALAFRTIDLDYPGSVFAVEARSRLASLLAAGVAVPAYTLDERVGRATRLTSTGPMQLAHAAVEQLRAEPTINSAHARTLTRLAIRIARVEGRFADVDALERELRTPARDTRRRTPDVDDTDDEVVVLPAVSRETAAAGVDPATSATATAAAGVASREADPASRTTALGPTTATTTTSTSTTTATATAEAPETPLDEATRARMARARTALARAMHGHTIAQASYEHLGEIADVAAGGGLDDTLRVVMDRARGDNVPASTRFAVAMAASGRPGFEEAALAMLGNLGDGTPEIATGARYHRARLFERLGRLDDARSAFAAIIAADRSSGRYYTMWSTQRLATVDHAIAARDAARPPATATATATATASAGRSTDGGTPSVVTVDAGGPRAASFATRGGRTFDLDAPSTDLPTSVDVDALAAELETLADATATTYPWIGRSADLLRVRAIEEARAEMFEALIAHRLASGRSVHRYGLEAVSRGVSTPSRPARRTRATRATGTRRAPPRVARRPLDDASRGVLADVAAALGDHGTAIAFGGDHSADERPRAFALEVLSAARQYDVDPNLLWAVMRVESVYQPRIVSYAGAIGLMQIMPRTGRLIAARMGRSRFTTAQLLDPQTNLDFAAWYLKSLIDRFDGHVPLAVAAYNGGPHNVRVWLERSGPDMPLDAFLERIPFDQTHGYVRRVLTHYAAYRARDGMPMIDLGANVPPPRPDDVAF